MRRGKSAPPLFFVLLRLALDQAKENVMTRRFLRRLQLLRYAACGVIVATGVIAHGPTPVYAAPPKPATAASYYVRTTNNLTLYNLGYAQGQSDHANWTNSEVVLDFGVQWSDNNQVELTGCNCILIPYSTVQTLAEQFAIGYWAGVTLSDTTTVLRLGIGTNNSTPWEGSTLGSGWANVAVTVQNWLISNGYENHNQEDIWGANDLEPGFGGTNSQANAKSWADGYSSNGSSRYLDFGSADGCPPYGPCNNGWSQDGEYYVSWKSPAAYPLPEIYCCGQDLQWASISAYARNTYGVTMKFQGPLDDYPIDHNTATATTAWNAFWSALTNAGDYATMIYSCEINIAT